MEHIIKLLDLYKGSVAFVDQAISLMDALELSKDDFETVTNITTVKSLADFQRRTSHLARHQRHWLCAKMIEYGCEMREVKEEAFTAETIVFIRIFPSLENITISHVGKLRSDQSRFSLKFLNRLQTIHLESCQTEWEFPSGIKSITARYSELYSLNLDTLPNLESLELMTTTVNGGIQCSKEHVSLRGLTLDNSAVSFAETFTPVQVPMLEDIKIRLFDGTGKTFSFGYPKLRRIEIKESNLQCVFPTTLPHLECLSLIDCAHCKVIELPEMPCLSRLRVQGVPVDVLDLPELPALFHLDLSLTNIDRLNLSKVPNVRHLELQHTKLESLDCTAASSLRFLSVHGTPLKQLIGLSSSVEVLMLHQTELTKKPTLEAVQYLTFGETTDNNWPKLQKMIEYLEQKMWIRAGENYNESMLEPLKYHFGSCLHSGRIRRLQCEFSCRHDYLDLNFTTDGKAVVATDPGWDGERLSVIEEDVEDLAVNSLQVQCLYESLFGSAYFDLEEEDLIKVLCFESTGNGDGEDNAEVYYINPQIPLKQLNSDRIGPCPSGAQAWEVRNYAGSENVGMLRYPGGSIRLDGCQINRVPLSSIKFQIMLWLAYREVHRPLLPKMSRQQRLDSWMVGIAKSIYPSLKEWEWSPDDWNELVPSTPMTFT